jgi:multisubunit Na+/H+ antiporter MnhB subunit
MKTMHKKEVENLQGFILSIVGIAVVLAVGLIVLGQLNDNIAMGTANVDGVNSTAFNSTNAILIQMGTIPNWIGILITVALAFIVLGYFYNR